MCGIAGYYAAHGDTRIDRSALCRMLALLRHCGPDGLGTFTDGPVGFGHVRLSIIEVAGGTQPSGGRHRFHAAVERPLHPKRLGEPEPWSYVT